MIILGKMIAFKIDYRCVQRCNDIFVHTFKFAQTINLSSQQSNDYILQSRFVSDFNF